MVVAFCPGCLRRDVDVRHSSGGGQVGVIDSREKGDWRRCTLVLIAVLVKELLEDVRRDIVFVHTDVCISHEYFISQEKRTSHLQHMVVRWSSSTLDCRV